MELTATFTRSHKQLVEIIEKLLKNRGLAINSVELVGTLKSDSKPMCSCSISVKMPQGDVAEIRMSHTEILHAITKSLTNQGYRDFALELAAIGEDRDRFFRTVVCLVTIKVATIQRLPA